MAAGGLSDSCNMVDAVWLCYCQTARSGVDNQPIGQQRVWASCFSKLLKRA
jgi:hypothetical protein